MMDIAAVICIGLGAIIGFIMLGYALNNRHVPKALALAHGTLVVTGVVLLIIYALTTENENKHWGNITFFLLAALLGLYYFSKDIRHETAPKWLVLTHGLLAFLTYVWLVVHLLI